MEIYVVNDVLTIDRLFAFQVAAVFSDEDSLVKFMERKTEFIRVEIFNASDGRFVRFYPGGVSGYFNIPPQVMNILKGTVNA